MNVIYFYKKKYFYENLAKNVNEKNALIRARQSNQFTKEKIAPPGNFVNV